MARHRGAERGGDLARAGGALAAHAAGREVQADLYARLKEKEEEAERLRLLAATTKWIEAMPSVHYSPLTAALRRQGEIGEHLPRRARMLRARRAAHSCAPPQHRAAKPPIIHYRPVPVC